LGFAHHRYAGSATTTTRRQLLPTVGRRIVKTIYHNITCKLTNNLKARQKDRPDCHRRWRRLWLAAGVRGGSDDGRLVEGRQQAPVIQLVVVRVAAVARYAHLICIIYANQQAAVNWPASRQFPYARSTVTAAVATAVVNTITNTTFRTPAHLPRYGMVY